MKKWKRMLGFLMTVVLMGPFLWPVSASAAEIEERGISVPSGIEYSDLEGEITAFINQRKIGMASLSLAAYMVETVSGEDFCDYVHEHIFEPLCINYLLSK